MPEMIATIAISFPAHTPPNIALTESEKGAVELSSAAWLTVPNTASVPRM